MAWWYRIVFFLLCARLFSYFFLYSSCDIFAPCRSYWLYSDKILIVLQAALPPEEEGVRAAPDRLDRRPRLLRAPRSRADGAE